MGGTLRVWLNAVRKMRKNQTILDSGHYRYYFAGIEILVELGIAVTRQSNELSSRDDEMYRIVQVNKIINSLLRTRACQPTVGHASTYPQKEM